VLAFLLATGPLQAQIVYACSVMDTVMHGKCCCDDTGDCPASDCDDSYTSSEDAPCCEQTVEFTNDEQASQAVIPASQKSEIKSDVDPPAPAVLNSDWIVAPRIHSSLFDLSLSDEPVITGKNTYLITQRLRI